MITRAYAPTRRRAGMLLRLFVPLLLVAPVPAKAQEMIRLRDLVMEENAVPIRLMGYGLVVGLDGTGDKSASGKGGGMTVNSVVNALKGFDIEVPVEVLRMKNVAAVLVTAEVSPYLRAGGRFEVQVSSLGDARSLRGGTLWLTPLYMEPNGQAFATAQGPMLIPASAGRTMAENSARMPSAGLLENALPRPEFSKTTRLLLKEPDVIMATRIAATINRELGEGAATVEDPGSLVLAPKGQDDRATVLARINDLRVQPSRNSRLIIDGRSGAVIAGGDITVGEASVSVGPITLTIGSARDSTAAAPSPGQVRVATGTPVNRIAEALHAARTPSSQIAAIFESLRTAGAITAEVVIR
jgi:flagellar P-ring protein precursor FlgI